MRSTSVEQTVGLGRQIGKVLAGGQILAVCGPLGSGKTCLIKGICLGCGCDQADQVTSPTFVLVNEYLGRLRIYHIDAYRLETSSDLLMLGFDELPGPNSVVIIEWADKVVDALVGWDRVTICMGHIGPGARRIEIQDPPAEWARALEPDRAVKGQ